MDEILFSARAWVRVCFIAMWVSPLACDESQSVAAGEELLSEQTSHPVPRVDFLSPPTWIAGQTIRVLGANFAPPADGTTFLVMEGEFLDINGQRHPVLFETPLAYQSPGLGEFTFEPDYSPMGFGFELGTFSGVVSAYSRYLSEVTPSSPIVPAAVDVGPSLIVWTSMPSGRGCAARRVDATLVGERIRMDLEAIGMRDATPLAPLTFRMIYTDADGKLVVLRESITHGRNVRLTSDPQQLPEELLQGNVQFLLDVEDANGFRIQRTLTLTLGQEIAVRYDGNVRIVELYAPVQVSSCIPGGTHGRQVSYTGGNDESRSRSVSYSANVSVDFKIISAGFGTSVSDTVSSSESESLSMSGTVLPNQFGVFYRQTQRLERVGAVVERTVCGDESVLATVRVTDWDWAPDLAITTNGTCPPAPPSNLPPAGILP